MICLLYTSQAFLFCLGGVHQIPVLHPAAEPLVERIGILHSLRRQFLNVCLLYTSKGRNNYRKQTFDAVCRTILFDIARRHGLHLDQEPSYGGRDYCLLYTSRCV